MSLSHPCTGGLLHLPGVHLPGVRERIAAADVAIDMLVDSLRARRDATALTAR